VNAKRTAGNVQRKPLNLNDAQMCCGPARGGGRINMLQPLFTEKEGYANSRGKKGEGGEPYASCVVAVPRENTAATMPAPDWRRMDPRPTTQAAGWENCRLAKRGGRRFRRQKCSHDSRKSLSGGGDNRSVNKRNKIRRLIVRRKENIEKPQSAQNG